MKQYQIKNRKYLGAKTKLLPKIIKIIHETTKNKFETFVDLFSGTGVVGAEFINNKKVIFNDFLISNKIVYDAFFGKQKVSEKRIGKIYEKINKTEGYNTYFIKYGKNKFFTINDAKRIGMIRNEIDKYFFDKEINIREKNILIASLLFSADRIANSMGHYETYINRKINDKFSFNLIKWNNNPAFEIHQSDANELIKKINGDVLYLDPPYNSRQYGSLYHVLDNLAKWDDELTFGKGLKPKETLKSKYSLSEAREAMLDLILNADFKWIFVSYNNTNSAKNSRTAAKISEEELINILSLRGKVSKIEIPYTPYSSNGTSLKNYKELLFIVKVNKPILSKMLIKYPFNYMGNKLKQISSLEFLNTNSVGKELVEPFGGGANVSVNMKNASSIKIYDNNSYLIDILNLLKNESPFKIIYEIEKIIAKYRLSYSRIHGYKKYGENSDKCLKNFNNKKYLLLRRNFNSEPYSLDKIYELLTLILYSFNNSMNFNLKEEFNIPCGKRDFNLNIYRKILIFSSYVKTKNISFNVADFSKISYKNGNKSIYYFDPPYLVGYAHYNKGWTENEEKKLLKIIDKLFSDNVLFVLHNSLRIGEKSNEPLKKFISERKNKLLVIRDNKNYDNSWFNKKSTKLGNEEVIITNIYLSSEQKKSLK